MTAAYPTPAQVAARAADRRGHGNRARRRAAAVRRLWLRLKLRDLVAPAR